MSILYIYCRLIFPWKLAVVEVDQRSGPFISCVVVLRTLKLIAQSAVTITSALVST